MASLATGHLRKAGKIDAQCHVLRTGHYRYIYSFFPAFRAPSFIHIYTNTHSTSTACPGRDTQAQSSLLKPNLQLDHAHSNSLANGLPPITISALQGQYLAIQCQLIGARSVLEIGTLGGYSTIWFASTGARVTSIEINTKHRSVALENTKGLDVEIILGAALDVLPKLAREGRKFDLVFIDADWEEQWEYFQWAVKLTRLNGCIYVDNVVRELLEHENVGESESLVTKMGREESVTATLVSTVSSHKTKVDEMFDGFMLAVVNGDK